MTTVLAFALIFFPVHSPINQCNDDVTPSYSISGDLYGDQNGDGILSGSECDWR